MTVVCNNVYFGHPAGYALRRIAAYRYDCECIIIIIIMTVLLLFLLFGMFLYESYS